MPSLRGGIVMAVVVVAVVNAFMALLTPSPVSARTGPRQVFQETLTSLVAPSRVAPQNDLQTDTAPPGFEPKGIFPFWINVSCDNTSPGALAVEVDGVNTTLPTAGFWQSGSVHNVTVVYPEQWPSSCHSCIFASWGDDSTNLTRTVAANDSVELSARFLDYYVATATTTPIGHSFSVEVNYNPLENERILDGWGIDFMEVLVRPGIHAVSTGSPQFSGFDLKWWYFARWDDGNTDTDGSINVAGPGCTSIDAHFWPTGVEVTIVTNMFGLLVGHDSHSGTEPLQFFPAVGTQHTVFTYSPQTKGQDRRYTFDHWVDNVTGLGPSTLNWTVTIPNVNVTYSAIFHAKYGLRIDATFTDPGPIINISGVGGCPSGSAPLDCWVDEGASPILEAVTPQVISGCRFVFLGWGDGDTRTVRPIGPVSGPLTFNTVWTSECYVSMRLTPTCNGNLSPGSGWYQRAGVVNIVWAPPGSLPPTEWFLFWRWRGTGNGSHSGPLESAGIVVNGPIDELAHCFRVREVTFIDSSRSPGLVTPLPSCGMAMKPIGVDNTCTTRFIITRQRLIRPLS